MAFPILYDDDTNRKVCSGNRACENPCFVFVFVFCLWTSRQSGLTNEKVSSRHRACEDPRGRRNSSTRVQGHARVLRYLSIILIVFYSKYYFHRIHWINSSFFPLRFLVILAITVIVNIIIKYIMITIWCLKACNPPLEFPLLHGCKRCPDKHWSKQTSEHTSSSWSPSWQ